MDDVTEREAVVADVHAYSRGVFCSSICAPAEMSGKEAAEQYQAASPAGTEYGWQLSSDETFRDGTPQGSICENNATRRHWLVDC